ncbi:MAG: SDR family oxidoreductase [Actinomycetota bacterium]|nr:SDR family oxidoreductase [Actinomycetota bacterium]
MPLSGRVALVTGVSRRVGIAWALVERLHGLGATVFATGWPPHDGEMPWGEDPLPATELYVEERDLEPAREPGALVDAVVERFGAVDIVAAVHARSSHHSLAAMTAEELDRCWAVNVRSVLLLAQRFAERHDGGRPGGRMLWFTSGQHFGPMADELPYAVTKGALHQMTASVAEPLADAGIVVNCINPGPVDTGYATGAAHTRVASMFPAGRWGTTADVANLVAFLVSDEGGWIQGQVLDSEGGFRRWAPVDVDQGPGP